MVEVSFLLLNVSKFYFKKKTKLRSLIKDCTDMVRSNHSSSYGNSVKLVLPLRVFAEIQHNSRESVTGV